MSKANFLEAETFLAVAKHNGFGAAARELGVTQSTISRRIAALEVRIGRRLVQRTTRRMTLTTDGLSYAVALREVLQRLDEAEGCFESSSLEPEGVLRITMPTTFGRICVVPCIARLADRYPHLKFELDLSDRYVDLLEGTFDAAVRLESPSQSGIESRRICTFTSRLCTSPAYIARHGRPVDPVDIANHDCLALRTYAPRINWRASWAGRQIELTMTPRITVTDAAALRNLILEGGGLAILPTYLIAPDFASGQLVDALPGLTLPDREMYVAYPKHLASLRKITVLVEELKRSCERPPAC